MARLPDNASNVQEEFQEIKSALKIYNPERKYVSGGMYSGI
jgi:hypothetical protein